MEKGSFQAPFSEISELEFREELPPIPNLVPAPVVVGSQKSLTVQTLIDQNEDLMARLKVTLRRLTTLEDENENLRRSENQTRQDNEALEDQLLIWKEKERIWQDRIQKFENDLLQIRIRFPELELMEEKIERYKKYHDKIRNQVKPYIQQLKGYAQNLALEVRKLSQELEEKEIQRRELERRNRDLKVEIEDQARRQDQQNRQLISIYETEKDRYRLEISELRKINSGLENQVEKLDHALLRQDELENIVVALRRQKEELEHEARASLQQKEEDLTTLRRKSTQDDCQIEDLEKRLKATHEDRERQLHRADRLEEQLTSLRFLWKSKSDESEELARRIESLEKLNHELSQKLNEVRRGEASL